MNFVLFPIIIIDESFSIEQKINNTKHYIPITIQNMPVSENTRELKKHQNFLKFLTNASKEFVYFALERDHRLNTLFKNAQISKLEYSVIIDSENIGTYFISLDKKYVVRFCTPKFFLYHIPTGKGYSFRWISWGILIDPRKQFEFEPFTKHGEFISSCIHPKIKQMIFENTIKSKHKQETLFQFRLNFERGPKSPAHYSVCFANCLHMD